MCRICPCVNCVYVVGKHQQGKVYLSYLINNLTLVKYVPSFYKTNQTILENYNSHIYIYEGRKLPASRSRLL